MHKKELIVGISVLLGFLALIIFAASILSDRDSGSSVAISSGPKVGLIEITGIIRDSKKWVDWIEKLRKNKDVKAVLVHVNSPGGAVAPSQEVYEALKRVRKAGKPVVVSMSTVAASGGYYLSLAADTIVANPGTLTGSIGVILTFPRFKKLADKIGVEMETIKSGKMKDVGNQYRDMTPEERAYLQSVIDDTYDQFAGAVAEGRNLPMERVRELADGRVYTGKQAKDNGLVDVLGTYQDAIRIAGKLGHISGEPKLLKQKPRNNGLWYLIFGDEEDDTAAKVLEGFASQSHDLLHPMLEYRWIIE